MKAVFLRVCALTVALSLAGCASTRSAQVRNDIEVTRSHLGQPVARAQIAVEPLNAADANNMEYRSHAAMVANQLRRLGWTVVNTVGTSEQVALVSIEQATRDAFARRFPTAGGTVGTAASGDRGGNALATMLSVAIKRRSDATLFWEGRAISDASTGASAADRSAMVEKLADALFRDFPGESGRTISTR